MIEKDFRAFTGTSTDYLFYPGQDFGSVLAFERVSKPLQEGSLVSFNLQSIPLLAPKITVIESIKKRVGLGIWKGNRCFWK